MEISTKQKISLQHFEDIIITALEGGSNYWYELDTNEFKDKLPKNDKTFSEKISEALFNDTTFEMNVYDIERINIDDILGTVTQASIKKAIEIAYKDYPNIYSDFIEGTGDAETADVLFQLAVMGKLIFG